jgi:ribonuclease T1
MTARLLHLLRIFILLALAAVIGTAVARDNRHDNSHERQAAEALASVSLATLPTEARDTLALIKRGGPFPHPRKDGSTFGNFEKRLPLKPRGYYREYTVPTPGARNRGARRIVAGSPPETSGEYYYTDDHYNSFRRIKE